MAVAVAAAAALAASVMDADASAREISSARSSGFADSLWTGLGRPKSLSPSVGDGTLRCVVNCGPAFGPYVVRRNELLTSNTADVSGTKTVDATGRAMGVSGAIVVERLESDAAGSLMNWVVVGERTLDMNGTHSWSLLSSEVSLDEPWLPTSLYRFESSSFSIDFAAGPAAGATPEASTWAMMLIGFAGLSVAGYRKLKEHRRSLQWLKGIGPQ